MIDRPDTKADRIGVWVASVLIFIATFFISWVCVGAAVNWAIAPNCPEPGIGGGYPTADMCGLTEIVISIVVGFFAAIVIGIVVARKVYTGADPSDPNYRRPL
jgi:hypothetical protein